MAMNDEWKDKIEARIEAEYARTRLHGTAPLCPYFVNGRYYRRGYFLVNGNYLAWSVFVKEFSFTAEVKEKAFKKLQESARIDVDRAFGVLKGRLCILSRLVHAMKNPMIYSIVYVCIILHNMLIKEYGCAISPDWVPDPPTQVLVPENVELDLLDEDIHHRLRYNLAELVGSLGLEFPESGEE
ncbi:uncharacterized protein LOC143584948 [Bidens hawaiensis]|uniref:uncharacterized protein LOC143584948 n=1 Tax=Bidens hawaiensis TaxID=980011 RepID=UPI00404B4B5E